MPLTSLTCMIQVLSAIQVSSIILRLSMLLDMVSISHVYQLFFDYLWILEPPLQVTFINSSPRVSGKTMIADFTINRPTVSMECRLSGQPSKECKSCSFGE